MPYAASNCQNRAWNLDCSIRVYQFSILIVMAVYSEYSGGAAYA